MLIDSKQAFFQRKERVVQDARGVSLLEAMIAVFLTAVGIMAIMSLQPTAWKTSARADYLGRAAMILSAELERRQALIMNPCNGVVVGTTADVVVYSSLQNADMGEGDGTYWVTTTIASIGANIFSVTVKVEWDNKSQQVTERMDVIRQELWRFPAGCSDA